MDDVGRNSGWLTAFYIVAVTVVAIIALAINVSWAYKYERDIRLKLIDYATACSLDTRELHALLTARPPSGMREVAGPFVMVGALVVAIGVVHSLVVLAIIPRSGAIIAVIGGVAAAVLGGIVVGRQLARRRMLRSVPETAIDMGR